MIRSTVVPLAALTCTAKAPPELSRTAAALDSATKPVCQFRDETVGGRVSAGKAIKLPFAVMLVTAKLKETAETIEGIQHCDGTPGTIPVIWKLRVTFAAKAGGTAWSVNPFPRVSAMRQRVTATYGRGGDATSICKGRIAPARDSDGGLQKGGTVQLCRRRPLGSSRPVETTAMSETTKNAKNPRKWLGISAPSEGRAHGPPSCFSLNDTAALGFHWFVNPLCPGNSWQGQRLKAPVREMSVSRERFHGR